MKCTDDSSDVFILSCLPFDQKATSPNVTLPQLKHFYNNKFTIMADEEQTFRSHVAQAEKKRSMADRHIRQIWG